MRRYAQIDSSELSGDTLGGNVKHNMPDETDVFDNFAEPGEPLWFHFYLNWGYPDYLWEAFRRLSALRPSRVPSFSKPLSWANLNELIEEADSLPVKLLVASSPQTSPAVLDYLSVSDNQAVAEHVAENPSVDPRSLRQLACHGSVTVLLAVVEHPSVPADVLVKLVECKHDDVRYRMAELTTIDRKLLERLSVDSNPYVGARAQKTLQVLDHRPAEVIGGNFGWAAQRRAELRVAKRAQS